VAWARVLAAVSRHDDVVFGTTLFGRMQGLDDVDRALGLFMNTLPLRIRADGRGVRECVQHTHERIAQLLRHEHASLALAQRCSGVAAPTPLFSALLNYRHIVALAADAQETPSFFTFLSGNERTNYPVTLSVDDFGGAMGLTAQVQSPLDPRQLCTLMATTLEQLTTALERAPATSLNRLEVLSSVEREQLLLQWNETQSPFPECCIHQLFEEQAALRPDAVAVVYNEAQLTYAELNAHANRLAHYLRTLGVWSR